MGGAGSGNWYRWDAKTTVEDCRTLSSSRLTRQGILQGDIYHAGSLEWRNAETGGIRASIGWRVDTTEPWYLWLRLDYTLTRTDEQVSYEVGLQVTHPYFGGVRWWFTCPLVRRGQHCRRRCEKLYLPPGASYYGCRRCYNLAYSSQGESQPLRLIRKRDKLHDRLGWDYSEFGPPPKPKGMHWATYSRLLDEAEVLDLECEFAMVRQFCL